MIIISFKDGQGLGNQLWLFASAKSICEKLGLALHINNFEKFKGKDFLNLDYTYSNEKESYYKNNFPLGKFEIFNERVFYDSRLKYIISSFDERVLLINKDTILKGLFQSEKYFFGDLEKLKRYIKPKESIKNSFITNSESCILNIRGGEYKRHKKFILPKKYWENAIKNFREKFSISNFQIVTDDFNYARSLFPCFEIIHGDICKCYMSIYNTKYIIVSNSSFSYFPCKTGLSQIIIAPMYWARPSENFGRWISPGNIYKDWLWQDNKNKLHEYSYCYEIAENTNAFYEKEYTVLISKKDVPKTGVLNFIPKRIKKILKKLLGFLFPQEFG